MTVERDRRHPLQERDGRRYDKLGYGELSRQAAGDRQVASLGIDMARPACPAGPARRGCCHAQASRADRACDLRRIAGCHYRPGLVASVMRFFGYPLVWSVDLAQLLFIWVCFLGADEGHAREDASRPWRSRSSTALQVPPLAGAHCSVIILAFLAVSGRQGIRAHPAQHRAHVRRQHALLWVGDRCGVGCALLVRVPGPQHGHASGGAGRARWSTQDGGRQARPAALGALAMPGDLHRVRGVHVLGMPVGSPRHCRPRLLSSSTQPCRCPSAYKRSPR